MKSKILKPIIRIILPLVFWLLIWQIIATVIDNSFLFAGIPETIGALSVLLTARGFYSAVILSVLRVFLGLVIGIVMGILLAMLCTRFSIISALVLPIITVIKSTPVASFIVVLWVMMSGNVLSVFIGFLMVLPIITQNMLDGYAAIDNELSEVAEIFGFSTMKRFRLLVFPTLKKYLVPAIITASGLAWKAEIAAEIIAYTKRSIGQGINDAKYNMDTPTVFAWTVIIIILSISLEGLTKYLLRRVKK